MKTIFFFLFSLQLLSFYSQKLDCKDFKKGKYFYTPPNGGEVTVKRSSKKQVEYYNNENQRFVFKITWTNECAYTLELIKTHGVRKSIKKEIIGSILNCEVIEAKLGHYKIAVSSIENDQQQILIVYAK